MSPRGVEGRRKAQGDTQSRVWERAGLDCTSLLDSGTQPAPYGTTQSQFPGILPARGLTSGSKSAQAKATPGSHPAPWTLSPLGFWALHPFHRRPRLLSTRSPYLPCAPTPHLAAPRPPADDRPHLLSLRLPRSFTNAAKLFAVTTVVIGQSRACAVSDRPPRFALSDGS